MSHPLAIITGTTVAHIVRATELLEKANADLQPELLPAAVAPRLLAAYACVQKLGAYGVASLTRKLDDAGEVARVNGTSMGKAEAAVATGKVLRSSDELGAALQPGEISLDQAAEIAAAEHAVPRGGAGLV